MRKIKGLSLTLVSLMILGSSMKAWQDRGQCRGCGSRGGNKHGDVDA